MNDVPDSGHRVIEPSVLYLGTPVYLVATLNANGRPNLAPASSHFALRRTLVLGLEEGGQTLENLRRLPELTVNFPDASRWQHVERLAGVTGRDPVPADKAVSYTFESDKFARAELTPIAADLVSPPLVKEAPLQLEARVIRLHRSSQAEFCMVETEVLRVHAEEQITIAGTHHLDPEAWHPLIYAYRHFYDRGDEVGWTRKSPIAELPAAVERWERAGGTWRVAALGEDFAEVELLRCDGGEIVDRLTLRNPRDRRWAAVQLASGAMTGDTPGFRH